MEIVCRSRKRPLQARAGTGAPPHIHKPPHCPAAAYLGCACSRPLKWSANNRCAPPHTEGLSPGGHRFVDHLDNAVLRRLSTDAPVVPTTTLVFDIDNTLYDETSGLGENAWRIVYEYMVEKLRFPTIGFAKTVRVRVLPNPSPPPPCQNLDQAPLLHDQRLRVWPCLRFKAYLCVLVRGCLLRRSTRNSRQRAPAPHILLP